MQQNRTEEPVQPDSSMALKSGEKSSKVRKCGPDTTHIFAILGTMMADQRDHNFAQFGEAYFTYRKIVAGWIMDVGEYFCLHPTTTHAAVAYLDRLHLSKFSRHEWQMLAVSCILIAAKYNEKEEDVPDLLTLESILKQPIPNEILLKYEMWALQKMGWKLNVYTPLAFISCYVACGVCHLGDTCCDFQSPNTTPAKSLRELDARIAEDCFCLASIALLEMAVKPFKASDTASAILFFVRQSLKVVPVWTAELTELTKTDPQRDGFKAVYKVLSSLFSATSKSAVAEEDVEEEEEEEEEGSEVETAVSVKERERERVNSEKSQGTDPCALLTPIKGPSHSHSHSVSDSLSADGHTSSTMITPEPIRCPLSVSDGNDSIEGISLALSSSTLSDSRTLPQRSVPLDDPDLPLGVYCTPIEDKENSCRTFQGPSPGSVAAMDSLEGV